MTDIIFKKLTKDDGIVFCHFLKEVFGEGLTIDEKIYEHIHFNNPAGESILYGAWDGDKLVGTNALTKAIFWIHGRETVLTHSGSTATHPNYRCELIEYEGNIETIVSQINNLCEEEIWKQKITLSYGFPNKNSFPLARHIRFENIGVIPIMIDLYRLAEILMMKRPVFSKIFCRIVMAVPQCLLAIRTLWLKKPKGNYSVTSVKNVDEEWDRLAEKVASFYPIIQKRDSAFLRWRYLGQPSFEFKIFEARKNGNLLGYLVSLKKPWPEREKHKILCGYIVDFLVTPDEEGETVLHHLLYEARKYFIAQKVVITTSIHSLPERFTKIFSKVGFFTAPHRISPRPVYFNIRPEATIDFGNEQTFLEMVRNSDNWYLNMADNDIV